MPITKNMGPHLMSSPKTLDFFPKSSGWPLKKYTVNLLTKLFEVLEFVCQIRECGFKFPSGPCNFRCWNCSELCSFGDHSGKRILKVIVRAPDFWEQWSLARDHNFDSIYWAIITSILKPWKSLPWSLGYHLGQQNWACVFHGLSK